MKKRGVAMMLGPLLAFAGSPLLVRPAMAQTAADSAALLVPPGHGTLRFDDVTVQLRTGPLLIKLTPLTEIVTRLLAPDMYQRYHALAESKRKEAGNALVNENAQMFLVSFFSYQPDVEFQPEDLQLSHQGRLLQPILIQSVTPGWGRQRLAQQQSESAIYFFDDPIDYKQRLVVRYGMTESDAWSQIIPKLDIERSKVRAKAGVGGTL